MNRRYANSRKKGILIFVVLFLLLAAAVIGVHFAEKRLSVPIPHAGEQVTAHTSFINTAQVFMNDRWYAQRNVETLLVMGIDESGILEKNDSYNNSQQTDFLVLFARDLDTGGTFAVPLNRDTMTDITTLGVTGQQTGTRYAQLALAYNYGSGDHISSRNVTAAVEHLLYGVNVDHYITVTMDAVPIINDWAGGVVLEVLDDFADVDDTLVQGELVRLDGQQALTYVRARMGLDDGSNVHRMERQRQYAIEWVKSARNSLSNTQAVAELALQLNGYYRSSCNVEQLQDYAQSLSINPSLPIYEIPGAAVQGETYMEFYADENALQQLVLELFYVPVE